MDGATGRSRFGGHVRPQEEQLRGAGVHRALPSWSASHSVTPSIFSTTFLTDDEQPAGSTRRAHTHGQARRMRGGYPTACVRALPTRKSGEATEVGREKGRANRWVTDAPPHIMPFTLSSNSSAIPDAIQRGGSVAEMGFAEGAASKATADVLRLVPNFGKGANRVVYKLAPCCSGSHAGRRPRRRRPRLALQKGVPLAAPTQLKTHLHTSSSHVGQ